MTTPEQIDEWLKTTGKDRAWLADKIGIRMGTLYNCFSRGFPTRTLKAIEQLMEAGNPENSGLEVSFSAKEFELIEQARKLSGHATRAEFYHDAIMEFTDELMQKEETEKDSAPTVIKGPTPASPAVLRKPITYKPLEDESLRVAER